jgi:hypothetical protein
MSALLVMEKPLEERCPHPMCYRLCTECIDAQNRYKNVIHHPNKVIAEILNSDKSFTERLDMICMLEEF